MSTSYISLTPESYQCIINMFFENDILRELRESTQKNFPSRAHIQISQDQAQFMQIMVRSLKVKSILEIGTFTGYSALAMALALPEEGRLLACDVSKDYTDLAKSFWQKAGVGDKVKLVLAPAMDTLSQLAKEEQHFDLVFIDANEDQYVDYFNSVLKLTYPGSIIIVDNVLALNGSLHTDAKDERAKAMLAFNQYIANQSKVDCSIIPVGGGMAICYVK